MGSQILLIVCCRIFLFPFVGLPISVAIQIKDGYMESGVLFYAFDIDFSLLSVPL